MPIYYAPQDRAPDPLQQMGQMYDFYSQIQMAPLRQQLAEGQLAAQQQNARATEQSMGLATKADARSQAEADRVAKNAADAETQKVGERQYTIDVLKSKGLLAPGDEAMLASGGDPSKLLTAAGRGYNDIRVANDPILEQRLLSEKEQVRSSRAAQGASAASREASLAQRDAIKESRDRQKIAAEASGKAYTLSVPSDADPAITAQVQTFLQNGGDWSQLPKPIQAKTDPALADDQKFRQLQKDTQQYELDKAKLDLKTTQGAVDRLARGEASPEEAHKAFATAREHLADLEVQRAASRATGLDDLEKQVAHLEEARVDPREIASFREGKLKSLQRIDDGYTDTARRIAALHDPILKTTADLITSITSPGTSPPKAGGVSAPAAAAPMSDAALAEVAAMSIDRFIAQVQDVLKSGLPDAQAKAKALLQARGIPDDPNAVAALVKSSRKAPPPRMFGLPSIDEVQANTHLDPLFGASSGVGITQMMGYGQGDAEAVNALLEIQKSLKSGVAGEGGSYGGVRR